jgi:hypothetical protein
MTRHLINLEHLCNKLERRYGEQDPLFVQVKSELETLKVKLATVPMRHDWGVSYRKLLSDHKRELVHRGGI